MKGIRTQTSNGHKPITPETTDLSNLPTIVLEKAPVAETAIVVDRPVAPETEAPCGPSQKTPQSDFSWGRFGRSDRGGWLWLSLLAICLDSPIDRQRDGDGQHSLHQFAFGGHS